MMLKVVAALTLSSALASDVVSGNLQHEANVELKGCRTKPLTAEEKAISRKKVQNKMKELKSQGYDISAKEGFPIDVYFHVITSSSGEGALTSQQIDDQIAVLNTAFSPRGWTFTLKETTVTASDAWFDGEDESGYKNALRRGTGEDLNFYTGGLDGYLGWAYYPTIYCCGNEYLDGVVVDYRSVPGGSYSSFNEGDTGTHEVGHWLGLQHTFDDGCHSDPNGGDEVADTPQVASPNYACDTPVDSCPNDGQGNDLLDNFMDYVYDNCMDSFTPGQFDRAHDQFVTYREGSDCVINCNVSPPSTPTPTSTPDTSVVSKVVEDLVFSARAGKNRHVGSADVSNCIAPVGFGRIRVDSLKVVSADGYLHAHVDIRQPRGNVINSKSRLRIALGKSWNPNDNTFVWTQNLFQESDYVEYITTMPTTNEVPSQTHSIAIKLEYGDLVDSNGKAFSFSAGSGYYLQVAVEVDKWNDKTLAKDCGRVSHIELR